MLLFIELTLILVKTGVYNTKLIRFGREDYEEMYECKTMDSYVANEIAFDQRKNKPFLSLLVTKTSCLL